MMGTRPHSLGGPALRHWSFPLSERHLRLDCSALELRRVRSRGPLGDTGLVVAIFDVPTSRIGETVRDG